MSTDIRVEVENDEVVRPSIKYVIPLILITLVAQITKDTAYVFGVRSARIEVLRTPGTPQTLQCVISDSV